MTTGNYPAADKAAIQGILKSHRSPLPWWTIAAFHARHPDFSVAGYLTVMQCESGMGTTGGSAKHNNPGNIKYVPYSSKVWHTLADGKWYCRGQGYYNTYPDMYTGQRAAIRLLYDSKHGYNRLLASKDFEGFAKVYYGEKVPGLWQYIVILRSVYASIVAEAATYGVEW